jgi:hypothetical protein
MLTRRIAPLIAATLFATACAPVASDTEVVEGDLELENGGLDTTDEPAEFGEPAIFAAASVEGDTTFADPLTSDATVAAMRSAVGVTHLRVAIMWGQLPPDRTVATPRDWTGRIAISRGALVVRRTIGFEGATDRVTARMNRDAVAFTSMTQPFADGLVLEVLTDATDLSTVNLTYTSRDTATMITTPLSALIAGPQSTDVDALGNRMVATALRGNDPCDRGFIRGRWHALRPGLGRFLGVASDSDGNPIGHLRGIWGTRRNGEKSFYGKYIDADGRFRGLLVGHYTEGEFHGRWVISTGDHGRIQGMFREGAPGTAVGGAFVGRWAETSCAADLPAP